MKKKSIELDVDFIGEQKPLTKDEELAISEFIRKDKEKKTGKSSKPGKSVSRKNKELA